MTTKLFVCKLPRNATELELSELFAKYGQVVTASIVLDQQTGNSKLFGFVELATAEQGQAAIAALNGFRWKERALVVELAKPKNPLTAG